MSAHPQLAAADAAKMVTYILSLKESGHHNGKLGWQGKYLLQEHAGQGTEGLYLLKVSYTDKGANGIAPLTNDQVYTLRHPQVEAEDCDAYQNISKGRPAGTNILQVGGIRNGSFIMFKQIDLTDITQLNFMVNAAATGGAIEVRLGGADGKLIATAAVKPTGDILKWFGVKASLPKTSGKHDLYFVFRNSQAPNRELFALDWIYFQPAAAATGKRS
jgi:cytochrome c